MNNSNSLLEADKVVDQILNSGAKTIYYNNYLKPKVKPYGLHHTLKSAAKIP